MNLRIRDATVRDIPSLEALQMRASLVAPDYREQLLAHPEVIHLPIDDVAAHATRVATLDGRIAGFSVVLPVAGESCELDGLFVEPDQIRHGIGRELVMEAARRLQAQGVRYIDVLANPTALGFYTRLGFVRGDDVPTPFGPAYRMRMDIHHLA
jgi:GNAT superfamily N-acetyltransferase